MSRSIGETVTRYEYDAQDRVVATTDAAGAVTRYAYNGEDRTPSQVTDPTGAVSTNTVVDGLITETVDAVGAKTAYTYDSGRHLTSLTDAVGGITRYAYDAVGRTTEVGGGVSRVDLTAGRVTRVLSGEPGGRGLSAAVSASA